VNYFLDESGTHLIIDQSTGAADDYTLKLPLTQLAQAGAKIFYWQTHTALSAIADYTQKVNSAQTKPSCCPPEPTLTLNRMSIKEGIVIQGQSGKLIAACAGPVDHPASLRPIPRADYPQLWNSIIHLLRNSGGLTYKRQYQKKQQKAFCKNMADWGLPFFYEVMATTTRKTLHIGLTPEPNPDAGIPAPISVFMADLIIKATLLLACGIYWCQTQSPKQICP
jgi:hypothetical protein